MDEATTPDEAEFLATIERAKRPAADLDEVLRPVSDHVISTVREAEAVCDLLTTFPRQGDADESVAGLHTTVAYFQQVDSQDAFEILLSHGIPELCRLFDDLSTLDDWSSRNVASFMLKILSMYYNEMGTDCVLQAVEKGFDVDGYLWHITLSQFNKDHPDALRVMRALADPLPPGFIAVALLDAANSLALSGVDFEHPFDSEAGLRRLDHWLSSRDPDEFSKAVSSVPALLFLRDAGERDRLLAIAMEHPAVDVRMEAAWATARLGREEGIRLLGAWCTDARYAATAQKYLSELGRADAVPEESRHRDFLAEAEMCQWLAHPNELARVPDRIELIDTRELQ